MLGYPIEVTITILNKIFLLGGRSRAAFISFFEDYICFMDFKNTVVMICAGLHDLFQKPKSFVKF